MISRRPALVATLGRFKRLAHPQPLAVEIDPTPAQRQYLDKPVDELLHLAQTPYAGQALVCQLHRNAKRFSIGPRRS